MTIYLSKILHTSYLDDGNIPDRSCQFETFWQAAGLTEKDETSKISTLIYAIGDKADDILTFFKLTKAQKRRYSVVRQKFKVYFIKPSLKPATKSLLGPNRQVVDVSSQFTGTLRHRDTMSDKEIFVVPDYRCAYWDAQPSNCWNSCQGSVPYRTKGSKPQLKTQICTKALARS